jgi:hypothetical protein
VQKESIFLFLSTFCLEVGLEVISVNSLPIEHKEKKIFLFLLLFVLTLHREEDRKIIFEKP